MNFGQMKDYVAIQLDDLNKGYFTDAVLSTYVNNSQYEAFKLIAMAFEGYLTKCSVTSLVSAQRDYVLPEDFFKLEKLEVITSGTVPNESTVQLGEIPPSAVQNYGQGYGQGMPQVYYFKGNRLVLYPAPDGSANNLQLRLLYTQKILPMVNLTDISQIPVEYHEFICVLAVIDGLLRDGRDMSAWLVKRDYYEDRLKKAAERRSINKSRFVISTGSYDQDFWMY